MSGERKGTEAQWDCPVLMECLVKKACQEEMGPQGSQGQKGRRETEEMLDHRDRQELPSLAHQGHQENPEFHHYHHQYQSPRKVPGGLLEPQGCQGLMEMMGDLDQWGLLDPGEKLDSPVSQGGLGSLVFQENQVCQALQVHQAHLGPQVLQALQEMAPYHSFEMMTYLRGQETLVLDRRVNPDHGVLKVHRAFQGDQDLLGPGERLEILGPEDQWALKVCKA